MLLYIIRHGDPDYTTDTLTERGRKQAEALVPRLTRAGITRIFSSPMGRARQTAEPTARALGLEIEIEEWAHEIDREYRWVDEAKTILAGQLGTERFRLGRDADVSYEHSLETDVLSRTRLSEVLPDIARNADKLLEKLGYKAEGNVYRVISPSDEHVALFCHAALSRALVSHLLHIPAHLAWGGFSFTHTGVTVFEMKNPPEGLTAPRCLMLSDMSHLFASAETDMLYFGKKPV